MHINTLFLQSAADKISNDLADAQSALESEREQNASLRQEIETARDEAEAFRQRSNKNFQLTESKLKELEREVADREQVANDTIDRLSLESQETAQGLMKAQEELAGLQEKLKTSNDDVNTLTESNKKVGWVFADWTEVYILPQLTATIEELSAIASERDRLKEENAKNEKLLKSYAEEAEDFSRKCAAADDIEARAGDLESFRKVLASCFKKLESIDVPCKAKSTTHATANGVAGLIREESGDSKVE